MRVLELILKKALKLKSKGIVLAAHGISKTPLDPFLENVHILEKDFVEVIELLERVEVDFVDYETMKDYILGKRQASRVWVHITIDDGYKNNLHNLLPMLNSKNIPFTLFVSTFHVETQKRVSTYHPRFLHRHNISLDDVFEVDLDTYNDFENYFLNETLAEDFEAYIDKMYNKLSDHLKEKFDGLYNNQFLTIAELQELANNPLAKIASHADHHIVFHDQQNEATLKAEIKTSFEKFNSWDISAANSFCYPNGSHSEKVINILLDLGIETAFVSYPDFIDKHTRPLEIPRFWISKSKRMQAVLALLCMGSFFFKIINKM